jgi:Protein of unknown function (DUF3060)
MKPEDPEQYIRNLERGVSQPPEAAPFPAPPQPFGTGSGPPFGPPFSGQVGGPVGGPYSGGPYRGGAAGFGVSRSRWPRVSAALVVVLAGVGFFIWHMTSQMSHPSTGSTTPTVQQGGSLHATLEGGGQQTVVCNDGNLHADGDGGTFTVTGHCLTLTVTGDNIHVTVDSADTIDADGIDIVVVYHSGSPEINKTGVNTEVSQG